MRVRRIRVLVLLTALAVAPLIAQQPVKIAVIMTTSAGRTAYLAGATLWREPPSLTPADLIEGPPGIFAFDNTTATSEAGVSCKFDKPGHELGGNSPKFSCETTDHLKLHFRYWEPAKQSGNREVFATVAATRLMWALGFVIAPGYPVNLRCEGCPENPMDGTGRPGVRRYVAAWRADVPGPLIVSRDDDNQGWSWHELHTAIRSLPPGPARSERLKHYDALALLAVLMQHGDRKSQQQALFCMDGLDLAAGDQKPPKSGSKKTWLFEHQGATACGQPAAAIEDTGATFGGAGRTSSGTSAKMHLDSWRHKHVFKHDSGACRGDLAISMVAGGDGEGDPVISEEGRLFLLEQLHRLTPDHVRAIFQASQVDRLSATPTPSVIEEWVTTFQDKVRQIEAQRCQPES